MIEKIMSNYIKFSGLLLITLIFSNCTVVSNPTEQFNNKQQKIQSESKKTLLQTKNVEIYTLSYCRPCTKAKKFLKKRGISFKEIDIEKNPDSFHKATLLSHSKAVPQIFVDGKFTILGYSDLLEVEKSGKLKKIFFVDAYENIELKIAPDRDAGVL